MSRLDTLETALFAVFVVAADAFSLGLVPVLGLATLGSLLAFVLLEDRLRNRRYGANGFQ